MEITNQKSKPNLPVKLLKKVPRVPLRTHDQHGNVITKGIFVDPKSDFGFKRLFGYPDGKQDLIRLLNALLEDEIIPITDLSYLSTEILGRTKKQRKVLFDLFVKDNLNKRYELEMQKQPIDFMMRRAFSYASRYHSEEMKPGKHFKFDQPPFIGVIIANYNMPELKSKSCISLHQVIDNSSGEVSTDATKILSVQLTKFNKKIDELNGEKDVFLYLLANMEKLDKIPSQIDNDLYRPLFERARFANFNDKDMKNFNIAYKLAEKQRLEIDYALNKGRTEGKLEMAEMLLEENVLSAEKIAEYSGLPLSQIKEIEASLAHA